MTTAQRLGIVVALGALGAGIAELVDPGGSTTALVVLGAAVLGGELFLLRPAYRATPCRVLRDHPGAAPGCLTGPSSSSPCSPAESVAFPLRPEHSVWDRIWVTATRMSAAVAASGHLSRGARRESAGRRTTADAVVLCLLGDAGVTEVLARRPAARGAGAALLLLDARPFGGPRAHHERHADVRRLQGIGGQAGMGLSGPLCPVHPAPGGVVLVRAAGIDPPHLRADHHRVVRRAGARRPRAQRPRQRVAELSVDLGHELHLSSSDIEYLRAAALLHHLGHLCLDDPGVRGRSIEPSEVTDKGAEILRQTDYLRPAGDLLAVRHRVGRESDPARRARRRAHRRRHLVHRRGDRSAVLRSRLRVRPTGARRARADGRADVQAAQATAATPVDPCVPRVSGAPTIRARIRVAVSCRARAPAPGPREWRARERRGRRLARKVRSMRPTPITRSPKEIDALTGDPSVM